MELNLPVLIAAGVGSLLMGIGLGMFIAIVWYENKGIRRILGSGSNKAVKQPAIPDSQRRALNSQMFNSDGSCTRCGHDVVQHDGTHCTACRFCTNTSTGFTPEELELFRKEYENAQQAKQAKLS